MPKNQERLETELKSVRYETNMEQRRLLLKRIVSSENNIAFAKKEIAKMPKRSKEQKAKVAKMEEDYIAKPKEQIEKDKRNYEFLCELSATEFAEEMKVSGT